MYNLLFLRQDNQGSRKERRRGKNEQKQNKTKTNKQKTNKQKQQQLNEVVFKQFRPEAEQIG